MSELICPKCGSGNVYKDSQRGGWTGDYICGHCKFNQLKSEFIAKPVKSEPLQKQSRK